MTDVFYCHSSWICCCKIVCYYCHSDPFADDEGGTSQDGYIHIRIQQRNGRKTLTTVQGISSEFDLKKIVKVAKKVKLSRSVHVYSQA